MSGIIDIVGITNDDRPYYIATFPANGVSGHIGIWAIECKQFMSRGDFHKIQALDMGMAKIGTVTDETRRAAIRAMQEEEVCALYRGNSAAMAIRILNVSGSDEAITLTIGFVDLLINSKRVPNEDFAFPCGPVQNWKL